MTNLNRNNQSSIKEIESAVRENNIHSWGCANGSFSEACYEQNTEQELEKILIDNEIDSCDMNEWGLDEDGYQNEIFHALVGLVVDRLEESE